MTISAPQPTRKKLSKAEALRLDFRIAFNKVTDIKHTLGQMACTNNITAGQRTRIVKSASEMHELQWAIARVAKIEEVE